MRVCLHGGGGGGETGHGQVLWQHNAIGEPCTFGDTADGRLLREVVAIVVRPAHLRPTGHVQSLRRSHLQGHVQGFLQSGKGHGDVLVAHLHILDFSEHVAPLIAQRHVPRRVVDDVVEGVLLLVGHHEIQALVVLGVLQLQPHTFVVLHVRALWQTNGQAADILLDGQNGIVLPPLGLHVLRNGNGWHIDHHAFLVLVERIFVEYWRRQGIDAHRLQVVAPTEGEAADPLDSGGQIDRLEFGLAQAVFNDFIDTRTTAQVEQRTFRVTSDGTDIAVVHDAGHNDRENLFGVCVADGGSEGSIETSGFEVIDHHLAFLTVPVVGTGVAWRLRIKLTLRQHLHAAQHCQHNQLNYSLTHNFLLFLLRITRIILIVLHRNSFNSYKS